MARPRKPTEQLIRDGAFIKNPQRARPVGPKSPHDVGNPPRSFTPDEREMWREIVKMTPPGVLTGGDRFLLETLTLLLAKQRRREPLKGHELATITTALGRMGLTPSDRSRIEIGSEDDVDDEDAEFG